MSASGATMIPMLARTGVTLGLLLLAATAWAMGIRESKTLLATSAGGAHTLYEVRGAGPEGGGSLGYRLQGPKPDGRADYLVSSTFSPGDGSEPQTISADECAHRVDALTAALARRGFRGVATHPERCRKPARDGLVTMAR